MMALPIETPRLTLRNYQQDDWVQVHAYAKDPEVVRFMDWGPNSESDTRAFITRAMESEHQQPRRLFELAVIFKHTGALVGGVTLKTGDGDPHSAELGYTLHRLAWGQGLGTELARALIEFGFIQLPVKRVWAKCRPENIGSYRVMKKAGMRFEEYLQNDRTTRGQMVDSFLCGITKQDWMRR
jgi:RimJ/RimL family protein N-acetyltransferase